MRRNYKPRECLIKSIYTQRHHSVAPRAKVELSPIRGHLRLPNCSSPFKPKASEPAKKSVEKISSRHSKTVHLRDEGKLSFEHKMLPSPKQKNQGGQKKAMKNSQIMDSSKTILRDIDESGNEDIQDVNKELMEKSQRFQLRNQRYIQEYLLSDSGLGDSSFRLIYDSIDLGFKRKFI